MKTLDDWIAEAKERVARMDECDVKAGFAPPPKCPLVTHSRTIEMALECAISEGNWEIVADALVLNQQLTERFK